MCYLCSSKVVLLVVPLDIDHWQPIFVNPALGHGLGVHSSWHGIVFHCGCAQGTPDIIAGKRFVFAVKNIRLARLYEPFSGGRYYYCVLLNV